MPPPTATAAPERAAFLFAAFGAQTCADASPLYAGLAGALARDPELLELAAGGSPQPDPALFFAAVHFLLLESPKHPLGAYFPSIGTGPAPAEEPYPLFRQFCLRRGDMLRRLLATRRTAATPDIGPCACLLPAFGAVHAEAQERPLALIELGAGAGMRLAWDRYGYEYGAGQVFGDRRAPVRLTCEWRGAGPPAVPKPLPAVAYRLGVDPAPIDATDPDEALWLRAGCWPEDREAALELRGALRLIQEQPPPLVPGDPVAMLPDILHAAPIDAGLCVFHVGAARHWTRDDADDLRELLEEHSLDRTVYRVALEPAEEGDWALDLYTYVSGRETGRRLATCDPAGRWIDWD